MSGIIHVNAAIVAPRAQERARIDNRNSTATLLAPGGVEASKRLRVRFYDSECANSRLSLAEQAVSSTHQTRKTFQPSAALGAFWPIFILGERGEAAGADTNMLDALCPESADEARALYLAIFERVCPAAAVGLALAADDALAYWVNVLRGPLMTGEHDELTFLPSWARIEGVTLTGLTRLLAFPLHQRMDVFMAAMEMQGMGL